MQIVARIVKGILKSIFYFFLKVSHWLWGMEGINRLLLFSGSNLTAVILRKFGAKIGNNTRILSPIIIHNAIEDYANLTIGNNCHIGIDTFFDLKSPIIIEDNVTISMRTTILTHFDIGDSPLKDKGYPSETGKVNIKKGAYIGACAVILHNTTIGECSIVGACSLVNRNVPSNTIVAGIPAKELKKISQLNENNSPS